MKLSDLWNNSGKKGNLLIMSKIVLENLLKKNIDRKEFIKQGFTGQKYDDVLRGKSSYKLDEIIKMSEIFQLSLDYLIYGKEKNYTSDLTDAEQRMIKAFRKLNPDDKLIEIGRLETIYEKYSPEQKEEVS